MKIVIVGDGKVGSTLAEQLSREGHDITIVDRSPDPLQQTTEDLDILCIEGHGLGVIRVKHIHAYIPFHEL